jgi:hypothetical protein
MLTLPVTVSLQQYFVKRVPPVRGGTDNVDKSRAGDTHLLNSLTSSSQAVRQFLGQLPGWLTGDFGQHKGCIGGKVPVAWIFAWLQGDGGVVGVWEKKTFLLKTLKQLFEVSFECHEDPLMSACSFVQR